MSYSDSMTMCEIRDEDNCICNLTRHVCNISDIFDMSTCSIGPNSEEYKNTPECTEKP